MVCFFEFLVNSLVLFLDIIELAVEGFFLLLNSALLALNLFASVGNFLFALVSEAVNLVLTLKNNLFLLSFGSLDSVRDNLFGFFLSTSDFLFGSVLADLNAQKYTDHSADQQRSNDADYRNG